MASHHENNNVALPQAGLLAYFHPYTPSLHPQHNEYAPPSYEDCNASQATLVLDDSEFKDTDEESSYGFWSERDSFSSRRGRLGLSTVKRDHRGFYVFCCFWCAVSVCILGVLGMFFALDVVFAQFGMGTGWAMWMVRGNPSQTSASYEMNFCLASPNRQAPGPQTWRYIRPDNVVSCTTEVVTLSAASTEQWKLHLDDESLFGDDLPVKTGFERGNSFMSVDDKVRMTDLGDDLADESKSALWNLYHRDDEGQATQD